MILMYLISSLVIHCGVGVFLSMAAGRDQTKKGEVEEKKERRFLAFPPMGLSHSGVHAHEDAK